MSIYQQLNAPDMIYWRRPHKHSTTANKEIHFSSSCKYIKLMDWIIEGTSLRNAILLRHCKCGEEIDRSMLRYKKELNSSEFGDGVEIHFYTEENEQNCIYDIVKTYERGEITYELSKSCFCPRLVS